MSRDLSRLLRPKSIAIIGGGAWCRSVLGQLRKADFPGKIWLVHLKGGEIEGLAVHTSISDLSEAPDASFVGINREATIDVVAALSGMGAGGAVCFASGFAEVADGHDLNARLLAAAGDMPILGPNCYGMINAIDGALLWPDQHGLARVEGGVAILTQSSNIAINLTMNRRGLPIAYVVTCGNQAQTTQAEIAAGLLDDPRVTAIGLHIEGFGDYEVSLAPMSEENLSDPTLGTQMLYTSGTTGRPKGVYRPRSVAPPGAPNRADTVTRAGLAAAWNPESDRTLCTGPAYHAAPLAFNIVAPLNNGVGTVMMDKWDALRTLELIESHQITHTHMVATMFHRLLALGRTFRHHALKDLIQCRGHLWPAFTQARGRFVGVSHHLVDDRFAFKDRLADHRSQGDAFGPGPQCRSRSDGDHDARPESPAQRDRDIRRDVGPEEQQRRLGEAEDLGRLVDDDEPQGKERVDRSERETLSHGLEEPDQIRSERRDDGHGHLTGTSIRSLR